MSRGKWQFFIQNGRISRPSKRKTMPAKGGIDSRKMKPSARALSVTATSTAIAAPDGRTTRGPAAGAGAEVPAAVGEEGEGREQALTAREERKSAGEGK